MFNCLIIIFEIPLTYPISPISWISDKCSWMDFTKSDIFIASLHFSLRKMLILNLFSMWLVIVLLTLLLFPIFGMISLMVSCRSLFCDNDSESFSIRVLNNNILSYNLILNFRSTCFLVCIETLAMSEFMITNDTSIISYGPWHQTGKDLVLSSS